VYSLLTSPERKANFVLRCQFLPTLFNRFPKESFSHLSSLPSFSAKTFAIMLSMNFLYNPELLQAFIPFFLPSEKGRKDTTPSSYSPKLFQSFFQHLINILSSTYQRCSLRPSSESGRKGNSVRIKYPNVFSSFFIIFFRLNI
jgi:hypothetical protein